jgi:hypothetical protein
MAGGQAFAGGRGAQGQMTMGDDERSAVCPIRRNEQAPPSGLGFFDIF